MKYNHFSMLPENAFQKRIGFGSAPATLEGGSGGSTQQSTTYTTNIPEYLKAPAERMTARAEAITGPESEYEGYDPSARVAGLTDIQKQVADETMAMRMPGQFDTATGAATGALGYGARGAEAAMGVQGGQFSAPELQYFQMAQPGQFTSDVAQQYMSPYQQAVTDIAKREATSEGIQMQQKLASQAAKAGAFGGSRFGIEESQVYKDLGTRLSDLQVKGSQSAFENAQQQFERDRGAQMTAAQQNLQAALGVQQLGAGQALDVQKLADASRLQAAQLGLEGAQFGAQTGLQAAQQLGALGTAQQQAELQRLQAQNVVGQQERDYEQALADKEYEEFVNKRDFERNQLSFLSGILRGQPYSTTSSSYTPAPSTGQQVAGLGLAGLGAYNLYKG